MYEAQAQMWARLLDNSSLLANTGERPAEQPPRSLRNTGIDSSSAVRPQRAF